MVYQLYWIRISGAWAIYAQVHDGRIVRISGSFTPGNPRRLIRLCNENKGKFCSISYKVEELRLLHPDGHPGIKEIIAADFNTWKKRYYTCNVDQVLEIIEREMEEEAKTEIEDWWEAHSVSYFL